MRDDTTPSWRVSSLIVISRIAISRLSRYRSGEPIGAIGFLRQHFVKVTVHFEEKAREVSAGSAIETNIVIVNNVGIKFESRI